MLFRSATSFAFRSEANSVLVSNEVCKSFYTMEAVTKYRFETNEEDELPFAKASIVNVGIF